jgi:NAD(P)-dependent dehydrogenase (short-subunit alcohol dehydrogenase family)
LRSSKEKKTQMKVALITGASKGIGLATAKILLEDGYAVVGTYLTDGEIARKLESQFSNFKLRKSDAGLESDIDALVEHMTDNYDHIDVLVNNVGIDIFGTLTEYTTEAWDQMINVNLKSYFLLTKKCIPLIEKSQGKVIVNITSRLGIPERAKSPYIMYGITKAGVSLLTKGLAQELDEKGIRVNAVVPPATDTDLLRRVVPKAVYENMKSSGNLGKSEEVAELVVQLINDPSAQGEILFDKRVA